MSPSTLNTLPLLYIIEALAPVLVIAPFPMISLSLIPTPPVTVNAAVPELSAAVAFVILKTFGYGLILAAIVLAASQTTGEPLP